MTDMKVLILSCNTGQGHNTAGRAVMEEFQRRGVECEMRDALAFAGETSSRLVSGGYVRMATDAPKMFGMLYRVSEKISSPRLKSPVYLANMACAPRMGRYIRENGFDAVLATHVFPAQALTHLKHHDRISVKTYFIATDYTCHPFSEEADMDACFIGHPSLIPEYTERGVERDKLIPTGIPVSARFEQRTGRAEARGRLGIAPEKKVFLVMTGSMGAGNAAETARMLAAEASEDSVILVMTGRNAPMRRKIEEMHGRDARVIAVPFTTEVPLYMSAADVLITKPGGLTTTEAAVAGIPMVLSAPIPGCETANARFFGERGMAVSAETAQDAACMAIDLMNDKTRQEEMVRAQRRTICARSAGVVCDAVLNG